jgi:hypothetical protein
MGSNCRLAQRAAAQRAAISSIKKARTMKTLLTYEAFDGSIFDSKEECEAHEASRFEFQFVDLSLERVRAAMVRHESERALADSFEQMGNLITKARRNAGELKRAPKAADAPATESGPDCWQDKLAVLTASIWAATTKHAVTAALHDAEWFADAPPMIQHQARQAADMAMMKLSEAA